jgi:hypothetical protein
MAKKEIKTPDLIKFYDSGMSLAEIGKMLGCHGEAVRYRLIRANHPIRSRAEGNALSIKRRNSKIIDDITGLYKEGFSMREIGSRFHRDPITIRKYLLMNDCCLRSHGENQRVNPKRCGSNSPKWKGGIRHTGTGYIQLLRKDHPHGDQRGYVMEHLLVWEETYRKTLPDGYVIHHLNGIRSDNRPQNLFAMKRGEHIALAEPYKKRIRALESEISKLKQEKLF